jgi:hypothetical protein
MGIFSLTIMSGKNAETSDRFLLFFQKLFLIYFSKRALETMGDRPFCVPSYHDANWHDTIERTH